MLTMQRQFGKMTHKGVGDDAKVSVLLQDFESADKMLAQVIDSSIAWKQAWISILSMQLGIETTLEELYNPIVGATSDGYGQEPVLTPQAQLDRCTRLKEAFAELKTDLMDEVNMMDARIIKPASEAKDYIQPIRKTIKKRENKRLDYERYQDRVNHSSKKTKRSDRDEAVLAKAEQEMSKAADEFQVADAHLRKTLPPIIEATFSLLPHLLAAQIMTQTTLLAQFYTTVHNYCSEEGFPSPAPPMSDVIALWESDFKPVQQQVESVNTIARGKAVHTPMQLGDDAGKRGGTLTGLNLRNGFAARRASSQPITTAAPKPAATGPDSRVMRIPSSSSIQSNTIGSPRNYEDSDPEAPPFPGPRPAFLSPDTRQNSNGPGRDYFGSERRPSNSSVTSSSTLASTASKKKPPPPPPKPKRIASATALYVTALYNFEGQETGDLSFKEGDRIKIIKKTASKNDWWDGELREQKGRFPANYCEG